MWRSSFLLNFQACRLIARNFSNRWTPSHVILRPHAPPCIGPSPRPPHQILQSPHVLNTCEKPWKNGNKYKWIDSRQVRVDSFLSASTVLEIRKLNEKYGETGVYIHFSFLRKIATTEICPSGVSDYLKQN